MNPYEAEQARRLRRMKLIPLALLLLMAIVFVLTLKQPGQFAAYVHAFSEAAMIGALADWFAVTALFRHPLGIPIPHTAIIPTRKDEIADSMARFVRENFLQAEQVRAKLAGAALAARLALWLRTESAQIRVADWSLRISGWLFGAVSEGRVRRFVSRLGERHMDVLPLAPLAGKALQILTEHGRHQDILTQILRFLIVLLNDNSAVIRQRIQQESPWWLPGFVDDKIVIQMIQRIETLLFEMSLDPQHALRQRFNGYMQELAGELQTSGHYRRLGEKIKGDLLNNDALQDYLVAVWKDLGQALSQQAEDENAPLRQSFRRLLKGIADELHADSDMQQLVNAWLEEAIVTLVTENGEEIASLISDTVRTWDAGTTSNRVELAIGRDLQFIRINGTLVGGLVGLTIHALLQWLA